MYFWFKILYDIRKIIPKIYIFYQVRKSCGEHVFLHFMLNLNRGYDLGYDRVYDRG